MDQFFVLVFMGATALIVDAEPLICDGCTDPLAIENWAVEKFAAGREVYNGVSHPTEAKAKAWIEQCGYEQVRD